MIHLEERHGRSVESILKKYPYAFYAFGSRVKGTHRRFSDLDLCYKEPIADRVIARLEEEFEESELPFQVDIVDWNRCDPEFPSKIEKELQLIPNGKAQAL